MPIDPADLSAKERYSLLTACIVPRPVGWISTIDGEGRANLAPFSFFGGVSTDPPTVMLSVGRRRGERKDTARNLLDNGEGVVHIAHRPLASQMVACAVDAPPDLDEFDFAGLTKVASEVVAPPRVGEAAIAMEARVVHHQVFGAGPVDLFLLEILRFHLDESYLRDGLPDAARLAAVGRLGGRAYCDTSSVFEVPRPTPPA